MSAALEGRILAAIVGTAVAVAGLLIVANLRGCVTWCARQWMRRAGRRVEDHVRFAAFLAWGFRIWGAMLALVGLFLPVLACLPGGGWS
jgi:hypothetical protein